MKRVSEEFEGVTPLALRTEGRAVSHGLQVILQNWKREEGEFSSEPPAGG